MCNRRDLFCRAHELHKMNRQGGRGFGHWLRFAWAEAKAGTLASYTPEAIRARQIVALRREIFRMEHFDRLTARDYADMAWLRASLTALEREAA